MLEEQIKVLESLEEVDSQIDELQKKLDTYPREISAMEKNLRFEMSKVEEQNYLIKELETPKNVIEVEINQDREHVAEMSKKLNQLKTNEAYQAALKEISNFRRTIEEKENKLLGLFEQIEEAYKTLEVRQKVIDEMNSSLREKNKEAGSMMVNLTSELEGAQRSRERLIKQLDRTIARKYEFIRSRIRGTAVAKVESGACQACHMRIPPQLLNQLQRGDQIYNCPSCKRLIVLASNAPQAVAVHQ